MEDVQEQTVSYRYSHSLGITGEPYRADFGHLNRPSAIYINESDDIYMVEGVGSRLIKFDSSGNVLFSIGKAGVQVAADDDFSVPHEVLADDEGNIWVVDNHRAIHFDQAGNVLQVMGEGWYDEEEYFFDTPRGIAMDSLGNLYVSDQGHHRIQVFTISDGIATYAETIGESGAPGDDDNHFNSPAQIDFDSQDRLYIVDRSNFRVQRCEKLGGWTCTTFHGTGTRGTGLEELSGPVGIAIDYSDVIYIADTQARRLKKCDLKGSCSVFVDDLPRPIDVAIDSSGAVFVAIQNAFTISKYNPSGAFIGEFAGVSGVPYATDDRHIHSPWGLALAKDGSLYVAEYRGHRVIKFDPGGTQVWSIGEASLYGADNYHFGSWWGGIQGNMAIDSHGRIYVTDSAWSRMQIYSAEGVYEETFGEFGDGEYQLDCPSGVAISPLNGDVVINDRCNQRVQVYTSDFEYKATFGETDVTGDGSNQFHWPSDVVVDSFGAIFVTDSVNNRVQKCEVTGESGSCTTFIVGSDVEINGGNPFNPQSIAIDSAGRVIVSDNGNSRVLVFDSTGNLLTTIGGTWGTGSDEFVNPMGVAVDADDNVYVSDMDNYRIQIFAVAD
jgi:sugar lactone lactonase YvrE